MTTPFIDASVKHSIYLERFKARLIRDVLSSLTVIGNGLYSQILETDLERLTRKELDSLLAQINRYIKTGYEPILTSLDDSLRSLAVYEGDWTGQSLVRAGLVAQLGVASDADIWAAMYARPFQGKLLREWLTALPTNTARRVREAIRQGYVEGKTSTEMARIIRGTRANPGIMDISRRGAEAMVRTAVTHTSNVAREQTYKKNKAITAVQWLSVLDGRTSHICRGRDGTFYPVDKGPRPPAHVACRSTVLGVTKGNARRLEDRETYDQWLRRQSNETQADILGDKKAELFRAGETLDKFVDRSGKEYTLEQLKEADTALWDKAFGD